MVVWYAHDTTLQFGLRLAPIIISAVQNYGGKLEEPENSGLRHEG